MNYRRITAYVMSDEYIQKMEEKTAFVKTNKEATLAEKLMLLYIDKYRFLSQKENKESRVKSRCDSLSRHTGLQRSVYYNIYYSEYYLVQKISGKLRQESLLVFCLVYHLPIDECIFLFGENKFALYANSPDFNAYREILEKYGSNNKETISYYGRDYYDKVTEICNKYKIKNPFDNNLRKK